MSDGDRWATCMLESRLPQAIGQAEAQASEELAVSRHMHDELKLEFDPGARS
jgi:hypothetical protein